MTGATPKSLVFRLAVWALVLFAFSLPLFWFLYSAAVGKVSRDIVDTRLIEFADQVRGHWASQQAAPGLGRDTVTSDAGWVWQFGVAGDITGRSELLMFTDTTLPTTQTQPGDAFTLRTAETSLGPMRLAERIVDEAPALPGQDDGTPVRVHYVVGIDEGRYLDYAETHAARLRDLATLAVIPVGLVLFGLLTFIILVIRRDLTRLTDAMRAYENGATDTLDGAFPAELQGPVDHMNRLLRQNAVLVERTRKYVSKIAHDINHPLAILKNALAGEAPDKALMTKQLDRMESLVDRYVSLAKAVGPDGLSGRQTTDVRASLQDAADGFSLLFRRTPLTLSVACPDGLTFPIPKHDLEAMISNLASNAHKYADSEAVLRAALDDDGTLVLSVEDDGPGIPEDLRNAALNWGKRLDEAPPGAGFGLSIVADIADLYQGKVVLDRSDLGGLKVDIRIPPPVRHT